MHSLARARAPSPPPSCPITHRHQGHGYRAGAYVHGSVDLLGHLMAQGRQTRGALVVVPGRDLQARQHAVDHAQARHRVLGGHHLVPLRLIDPHRWHNPIFLDRLAQIPRGHAPVAAHRQSPPVDSRRRDARQTSTHVATDAGTARDGSPDETGASHFGLQDAINRAERILKATERGYELLVENLERMQGELAAAQAEEQRLYDAGDRVNTSSRLDLTLPDTGV